MDDGFGFMDFLQSSAWIATVFFVGTAFWAIVVAKKQLGGIVTANQATAAANEMTMTIAKAGFLLELDSMFESERLASARAELTKLRREIKEAVDKDSRPREEAQRDLASKKLFELREGEDSLDRYLQIMNVAGFFETCGLVVRLRYVELNDVKELYGAALVDFYEFLRPHIVKRNEDADAPSQGFFTNFEFLAQEVAKSS